MLTYFHTLNYSVGNAWNANISMSIGSRSSGENVSEQIQGINQAKSALHLPNY